MANYTNNMYFKANLLPNETNSGNLGDTNNRWKSIHVGSKDTYGGSKVPVYINNGVPTEGAETYVFFENEGTASNVVTLKNKDGNVIYPKTSFAALEGGGTGYWANQPISSASSTTSTPTFGKTYINSTEDVDLNQDGALVIGSKTGENIGIDGNEIMARNNKAASILYLNNQGGLVQIGTGGLKVTSLIRSTAYDNTVTIGSQDATGCHIYNSQAIPFIFNRSVHSKSYFRIYDTNTTFGQGYITLYRQYPYIDFHINSEEAYSHRIIDNHSDGIEFNAGDSSSGNNWFYIKGAGAGAHEGIRFLNYGGGWSMTDTNWIRSYGGKGIYTTGNLRADGSVWANKIRLTSNWIGWYSTAGDGNSTRYGYIQGYEDRGIIIKPETDLTHSCFVYGDFCVANSYPYSSSSTSIPFCLIDSGGVIACNQPGGNTAVMGVYNGRNDAELRVTTNAGIYHPGYYGSSSAKWLIYISTSGGVTANTSDRRLKIDKGLLKQEEAYNILNETPITNFIYTEDKDFNNLEQSGIYAQDLRDVLLKYGYKNKHYLLMYKYNFNEKQRNKIINDKIDKVKTKYLKKYHKKDKDLSVQDLERIKKRALTEYAEESQEDKTYYDLTLPENEYRYEANYQAFIPLLWKGWQMNNSRIQELEAEVARLKNIIEKR